MPTSLKISSILPRLLFMAAALFSIASTQAHSRALTDDDVEAVIATIKDMDTVFENTSEHGQPHAPGHQRTAGPRGSGMVDPSRAFSTMVEMTQEHPPTRARLASMVKSHGFDDIDEWAAVGDRVFTAYMAARAGGTQGQPSMTQDDVDQYMARIGGSSMPKEERERMRKNMESLLAANQSIQNTPQQDIETVRPYADEIESLQNPLKPGE